MKVTRHAASRAAAAVFLSFAGAAHSGSVTVPATDAAATAYAAEGIGASTVVTLTAVTYALGVSRAVGQNFTFIVVPSVGALDPTTCTPAVWVGSAGFAIATKRSSA